MGEPHLLQLLLLNVRGRIVLEVVTSAFKLVRGRKPGLLLIVRVESLKGWLECGTLRLCKCPCGVRKFD